MPAKPKADHKSVARQKENSLKTCNKLHNSPNPRDYGKNCREQNPSSFHNPIGDRRRGTIKRSFTKQPSFLAIHKVDA
jgi:hypothetical protein